jgi:trans-2,3-dihydro-3-hydroxyanthranilate isomerase
MPQENLSKQMKLHFVTVDVFTGTQFAGNPLGARAGQSYGRTIEGNSVIFEEKAGLVPISILRDGASVIGARVASPQRLSVGAEISLELIASACSLSADDIETKNHEPCIASCGAPFIIAELKGRDKLAAATARTDVYAREVTKQPATSILIYTHVAEDGLAIRACMFAPHHGIAEDPASGERECRADRVARKAAA